eukprot:357881-Chlamydomonas_euryale.AAC.16
MHAGMHTHDLLYMRVPVCAPAKRWRHAAVQYAALYVCPLTLLNARGVSGGAAWPSRIGSQKSIV